MKQEMARAVNDHALWRYATRYKDEFIATEVAFVSWKANNPEKIKEYTKDINKIANNSVFLVRGKYDLRDSRKNLKNDICTYRYDIDSMSIIISNKEDTKIKTIYKLTYRMDNDERNISVLQNFLQEIDEKQDELNNAISEKENLLERKEAELNLIGHEKKRLLAQIKELETKEQFIESEKVALNAKSTAIQSKIDNLYVNIIYNSRLYDTM